MHEPRREGLRCLRYEARNNVPVQEAEEIKFKDTLRGINPKRGLANVSSNHADLVDTKYGRSPVGSLSSYHILSQILMFLLTLIQFPCRINANTQQIEQFPRFPLRNQEESQGCDLCDEKMKFVKRLYVDEG